MFFIKDGKTEYSIVVKASATERVTFAVNELTEFLYEATGCRMQTATQEEAIKTVTLSVLNKGSEGYRIYSNDENYVIEGYSEKGLIYGVYGFLRRVVGLVFYTPDAYDINKGDIAFIRLDEERIPDIPVRAIGIAPLHNEEIDAPMTKNAFRMGVSGMADNWGLHNHSYFKILPPSVYKEAHPDWYSLGDNGVNLCLTNEEMRAEFTKRVKEIVLQYPNAKYFMLGQEDHPSICECEKCVAEMKKYGGFASMLMINFTNTVVKDVNAWLKESGITREVIFVMFAYQQTVIPPVKRVGESFAPLYDFNLEKNLAVMLAPLGARGDKSYFDEENYMAKATCYYDVYGYKTKELLLGWRAVVDKVCVWSYCNDFSDLFAPFNCWDAFEENYRWYKKINAEFVFEEGSYLKYTPNFSHLRSYLVSKLMWDSSISMESAIDEFFVGYYGASSAPYMRAYFDFLRNHCRKISQEKGRPMLFVRFDDFSDLSAGEYWDMATLLQGAQLHETALENADEAYKERVNEEGMPIWFILLLRYNQRLNEKDRVLLAKKVLAIIEKYNYDCKSGCEGISATYLTKIKKYVDSAYSYISGWEKLAQPNWKEIKTYARD